MTHENIIVIMDTNISSGFLPVTSPYPTVNIVVNAQ